MNRYLPKIDHAFENIKAACEERLTELFAAGIPNQAKDRLVKELELLEKQGAVCQTEIEVYRLLCDEARRSLQYVICSVTDVNRYILYLLNDSLVDPLPPHYYCEKCGCYEEVVTNLYGIDLPAKTCATCGQVMRRGGFNLPIEFGYGINGKKEFSFYLRCSMDFYPFAERVLKKLFPMNAVVPLGTLYRDNERDKIEMLPAGFFILPEGQTMEDYQNLQGYLEDGTPCLSDDWHDSYLERIKMMPYKPLDYLSKLQRKTGIYSSDIRLEDLKGLSWIDMRNTLVFDDNENDLFYNIKPRSFSEMTRVNALAHNSYVEGKTHLDPGLYLHLRSDAFKRFPCYTREDFYESILEQGYDQEFAFYLTEAIRKGIMSHETVMSRYKELHDKFLQMTDEFKEVARQYQYAISRGHIVQITLIYAMLAYYLKTDVKRYRQVVFQDKKLPSSYTVR